MIDLPGSELRAIALAGPVPRAAAGRLLELASRPLAPEAVWSGQLLLPRDDGRGDTSCAACVARLGAASDPVGRLVLWAQPGRSLSPRRMRLALALAQQMALLVTWRRHALQAGHQAVLDERARLCRELHDGVAQTLSYLKLRADQAAAWLENNEQEKACEAVHELRGALADLNVEVREALDGLSRTGEDGHLRASLAPVIVAFEERSGMQVSAGEIPDLVLPAPAAAQLQRIVQEALCNIGKHSGATRARLECQVTGPDLLVRIADDGRGFNPGSVGAQPARHGLRSMQERAALLDADLRIESAPGRGARVSLKFPITKNGHGSEHG